MANRAISDKHIADGVAFFRSGVLGWYDQHRRDLPWRAISGQHADPYHVWLSEIMLQQTVVLAAIPYFEKFISRWPTVQDLAAAPESEIMAAWAGLGYYARARNLHKCAGRIVAEYDGRFPSTQETLKRLPGIGEYTSAAIVSIAFDRPATVVDGNVERVVSRYFAISEPLPAAKREIRYRAESLSAGRNDRPGDFAQGMMDLGATICIPRTPRCGLCPLQRGCVGYDKGIAADLPYKVRRGDKPLKFGFAYLIQDDQGRVLLQKRPDKGLLGGMYGLPTSEWKKDKRAVSHPEGITIKNPQMPESSEVRHVFTHFALTLKLVYAEISPRAYLAGEASWLWVDRSSILEAGLPSLFVKCAKLVWQKSDEVIKCG